jgi:hypothetical protein
MDANTKVGAGRFTLVRPLGRGGMGEVWLAQDERLREPAALKFLPTEVRNDPVALDDLRRETSRSHRLSHQNIVRIHDLHEDTGGGAFIAMEFVDGPTLAKLRSEQPARVLSWEFLKPMVQQLCAALEYAHGEKVIHRDLKPANMMLDGRGRLKLADFGIAATVSDSVSRISMRHSTSGTLAYMSPQQLAGKRPQVTDDIYGLGATLYELLTSKPPFYTGDITHQVLNEMPEPVSERLAALEISNEIPPDVAALIMACLAKDPALRPQSAAAVAGWIGLAPEKRHSIAAVAGAVFPSSVTAVELPEPADPGSGPLPVGPKKRMMLPVTVVMVLMLTSFGAWKFFQNRNGQTKSQSGVMKTESAANRRLPVMTAATLAGKRFTFVWETKWGGGSNGIVTLRNDGTINGARNPDSEAFWLIDGEGRLVFETSDRRISTVFTRAVQREGKWSFSGPLLPEKNLQNLLDEYDAPNEGAGESGFITLFNGRDLTGWGGDPGVWSVKDGVISAQAMRTTTWSNYYLLLQNIVVSNFELRISCRLSGASAISENAGNLGIGYRLKRLGQGSFLGYQMDVGRDKELNGKIYETNGRRILAKPGQKVVARSAGSDSTVQVVGAVSSPDEIDSAFRPNDWNELTIIAQGNHVIQKINGVVSAELVDDDELRRSLSGSLVLKLYLSRGPEASAQFKNIRFKSLDFPAHVSTGAAVPPADLDFVSLFNGRDLGLGW